MTRLLKLCFVLMVLIIGLAFHLRNDQFVNFDYYLGTIELPFSLFLVIGICIGVLLGVLACIPGQIRIRRENACLQNQIRMSEKEVNNLRVSPVKDLH